MERVIVKDLKRDMKAHRDKVMQSHRVKRRLDVMQEAARKLVRERRCVATLWGSFAGGRQLSPLVAAHGPGDQITLQVALLRTTVSTAASSLQTLWRSCALSAFPQVKIYEDEDGSRREDIASLANKDNPFEAFYTRLREIKDYHTRFSTATEITEVCGGGTTAEVCKAPLVGKTQLHPLLPNSLHRLSQTSSC